MALKFVRFLNLTMKEFLIECGKNWVYLQIRFPIYKELRCF